MGTAVTVRNLTIQVQFAGVTLANVLGARGQQSADGGWPQCSVFLTAKPATGNEEDTLTVLAGAPTIITRFTGRTRRFRPSAFPKGVEMLGMGTLAYSNEWAPSEDIYFDEIFPAGATDQALVQWALTKVPGVTYTAGNIGGTGITLGTEAPEAFDWKTGMTAWSYIQNIDRATLYRTYQDFSGTIRRVRMIGHPDSTPDFTLETDHILDSARSNRDTERTRNYVRVWGHDFGDNLGPVTNGTGTSGSNSFQGDGGDPATRHVETFSSDLIESGTDELGVWDGAGGLRADQIAEDLIADVNKEFVDAEVPSWRDDDHAPGMTCVLNALDRLRVGEPMWVQSYAWEIGDGGWVATYGLTGGGLPPAV